MRSECRPAASGNFLSRCGGVPLATYEAGRITEATADAGRHTDSEWVNRVMSSH